MELGSLYTQNKTPKKGNKKADKQCKLSHKVYIYFPAFQIYHKKKPWIAVTIMMQSFDYYGILYLHYSGEGKKKFCGSSKEAGNESQGHWHLWWQIKLWADSQ